MPEDYTITIEGAPEPADVQAVHAGLEAYNNANAEPVNYRPLYLFVRDAAQAVMGGLLGATYWGWLHVDILWLSEEARGRGIGSQLLEMAEREAIARGCHGAHLDTMDFQALPFYERHGYSR